VTGFLARAAAPFLGLGRALVSFGLGAPAYPAAPAHIGVSMGVATTIVQADGSATNVAVAMGTATTIVITEAR